MRLNKKEKLFVTFSLVASLAGSYAVCRINNNPEAREFFETLNDPKSADTSPLDLYQDDTTILYFNTTDRE